MLKINTKAPNFKLLDCNHQLRTLDEFLGKKLFYIFILKTILRVVQNKHLDIKRPF